MMHGWLGVVDSVASNDDSIPQTKSLMIYRLHACMQCMLVHFVAAATIAANLAVLSIILSLLGWTLGLATFFYFDPWTWRDILIAFASLLLVSHITIVAIGCKLDPTAAEIAADLGIDLEKANSEVKNKQEENEEEEAR